MNAVGTGISETGRAAVAAATPSGPLAIPLTGPRRLDNSGRPPSASNASTASINSNRGVSRPAFMPASATASESLIMTPTLVSNLDRITSRFSTVSTLTQTALEELQRSGASKVEVAIEKKEYRSKCPQLTSPVEVTIVFIRHSESCANVLKRNVPMGGLRQKSYTDPELSERGIQMAQERSANIVETLLNPIDVASASEPWIIGSSTLFRAQQTAMYLSEGISRNRASDRIIVMPYIQETGLGEENVALDDRKRLELGLYKQLPGSPERLLTSLFRVAENPTKPSVDNFFNWLGCNLELLYRAGTANPTAAVPPKMRLLVVTHCNLMNEIYKKLRTSGQPSSMKYDNLEAMAVKITYSLTTPLRAVITEVKHEYRPSLRIKSSCPDNVCRFKEDICPKGAAIAPTIVGEEKISPYADICTSLSRLTGPVDYTKVIRPLIDRLKSDTRPQIVSARKLLESYKPSMFSRSNNVTIRGSDITTIIQSLECKVLETPEVLAGENVRLAAESKSILAGVSAPAVAESRRTSNVSNNAFGNTGFYNTTGGARKHRATRHHRATRRRHMTRKHKHRH